jgi:hypothetical protein
MQSARMRHVGGCPHQHARPRATQHQHQPQHQPQPQQQLHVIGPGLAGDAGDAIESGKAVASGTVLCK